MPNGDERFGGQVPQMVVRRRAPEQAHSSMRERGAEKPGRQIPGPPRNRGGWGWRISWGGDGASAALVALMPAAPGPRDLIVDRVEELCQGCEALLQRPLRGDERPVILGWAQLERAGEPVPVAEILELARYLLSRPTPDGTLPSTLRWCESTVQTLSRAALRSLPSAGRAGNRA